MDAKPEIVKLEEAKPNPAYVYLGDLRAATSQVTQANALKMVAEEFFHTSDPFSCDWASLRYEHLVLMATKLAKKYKPATARRYMAGVRGVLRCAWKQGSMTAEDYQRAISVKPIRGERTAGLMLEPEQLEALFDTCKKGGPNRSARDGAILALLFGCGLRRAEVASLNMSDYDRATGRLAVLGKGNKQRTAYVENQVKDALLAWLETRGPKPGPMFLCVVKSDAIFPRRVSSMSIWLMLKKRGKAAGLPAKFTAHDARRTFISNMLPLADIATVAKLAGHKSPLTTARYDRRPEQVAHDAASKLELPFSRKGRTADALK